MLADLTWKVMMIIRKTMSALRNFIGLAPDRRDVDRVARDVRIYYHERGALDPVLLFDPATGEMVPGLLDPAMMKTFVLMHGYNASAGHFVERMGPGESRPELSS